MIWNDTTKIYLSDALCPIFLLSLRRIFRYENRVIVVKCGETCASNEIRSRDALFSLGVVQSSNHLNPALIAPPDYSQRNSDRPCGRVIPGYFSLYT